MVGPTVPTRERPKLRVLVIDDSGICRASIRLILERDGDIEVVGEGEDAFAALPLVETLAPDVVTMDVQMPGKSGLEAVSQIMARRPVPILVVTAEPLADDAGVSFRAIENGAVEVIAKPSIADAVAGDEIRTLVRRLARTPVFHFAEERRAPTRPTAPGPVRIDAVTVIAGTGGMPSVLSLLGRLRGGLRASLVIHQPVAREMAASYAAHVARVAKQPVTVAEPPEVRCGPGQIVLVLGKHAVYTEPGALAVADDDVEPSASALLESAAGVLGPAVVAVILAGHEREGREGLRALRERGAPVLAASPRSTSAPDLPHAAVTAGLVDVAARIDDLVERLHVLTALR